MAYSWTGATTGTLKAKSSTSNKVFSIPGINAGITGNAGISPQSAISAVNYLLGIGGLAATLDSNTKFDSTTGAVDS